MNNIRQKYETGSFDNNDIYYEQYSKSIRAISFFFFLFNEQEDSNVKVKFIYVSLVIL